jgi:hypothetical protein
MQGTSLDDTIERLDLILDESRERGTYLGVFPAMYRSVTAAVLDAVRSGGFFDDDERIEYLTVTFAGLYLDAFDAYKEGDHLVGCWREAFVIAESHRKRMILQHLILGMNAHINLDLGIATSGAAPRRLPSIWADFIRVNEILFQILDRLQDGLGNVSPRVSLLDRLGGPLDESFMRIGIRTARDLAWHFAHRLDDTADQAALIAERDRDVAFLGRTLTRIWSPVDLVGRIISAAETTDVGTIIDALSSRAVDLDQATRDADYCIEKPPQPNRPLVNSRFRRSSAS